MKVPRAYSYEDAKRKKFKDITVDKSWEEHLGSPQLGSSSWFIYGGSGQGKTSYVLQLVKMLCGYYKVHYNTLEEGMKKSFVLALERNNIKSVKNNFSFHQENLEELTARLSRPRQPKIVVIDSVQYFFRGKNTIDYELFIKKFPKTTFIWISWGRGDTPIGAVAEAVSFDSDIRVKVDKFEARIEKNRFETGKSYIIWDEGYEAQRMKLLSKG
ncbi:ATPase [Myroides sp. A21]|uniref:hypothetical protein n=1 Tax=Myroides sp. A21 TaxID=1583100 RepID=UPI00057FDE54|nr:hypothetical protein [Myroides sp. A21]AJA67349.1 ATPase [Myroides sp. A21]